MMISHNELISVVYQAFLSMKRRCGEADLVARMVLGLQMMGLNGLRHFNTGCRFMMLENDEPAKICSNKEQLLEVDLHGDSLVCHLPTVLDVVLNKLANKKSMTLILKNCHNRWLAYSELAKFSSRGIACRARWFNGAHPKKLLFVLNSGQIAPELFFSNHYSERDVQIDAHCLYVDFSIEDFLIEQYFEEYDEYICSNDLLEVWQKSCKEGIFVDVLEWKTLRMLSKNILVKHNPQSLLGAGEIRSVE